tara:strand:+ start:107706 stop:108845 length:1140 start_codon:yes stop_codon:yes gene_type:complete
MESHAGTRSLISKRMISACGAALVLLAAYSVVTTTALAQNARVSSSNVEPLLPEGSMMAIVPADSANMRSFSVTAIDGRYRMGIQENLMDPRIVNQLGIAERNRRMRGVYVQRIGHQQWIDMLTLAENSDIFTRENMQNVYESGKRPYKINAFMRPWAPLVERAARGALADGPYREVFCVEEAPCPLDRYYGARPFDISGITPVWGAGYNEFRFRAAYQVFLDKYFDKLMAYANSVSPDVTVVGQISIPRYDFNEGVYLFRNVGGARMKPPAGGLKNVSTADVDIQFYENASGEVTIPALKWKLSRDAAEAFRNEAQRRKINQVYTRLDGVLAFDAVDRAAMGNPTLLKTTTHVKPTGKTLTFYYDSALTEEIVSFPFQ